ncbi:MAG: L-2-hydroxyglutarate oxidase [Acidimicrobiia bacterium]
MRYDLCIIGAGLIGLGVARAVADKFPGATVAIVDKEQHVAAHQSSHNSGVVHSGLYYRPGSFKARLCVEGGRLLEEFCTVESVPFRRTGKLVIASRPDQIPRLDELERRGRENGLAAMVRVGREGIAELEPAATGLEALHVPTAGVVDFGGVALALARHLEAKGVAVLLGREVEAIRHDAGGVGVLTDGEELQARALVNCAGLQSDRVAALAGLRTAIRIVPFRGEYYTLDPEHSYLVKSLIYPVPDPRFPFLGVHFSRRIDGSVEVGPNAVLALGREHYRKAPVDWADVRETVTTGAFWRLASRHWWTGSAEVLRSRSRRLYARSARRLVPAVRAGNLRPGGAGVRAQALTPDGRLVDDFVIEEAGATLHVLNAPSPGATASLAIGGHIAGLLGPHLAT